MERSRPIPSPSMIVAGVALCVALGGTSYAVVSSSTVPDSLGVFHACLSRSSGAIRIVAKPGSCRRAVAHGPHKTLGEVAVAWSQTGPAGKNGASGTNGTNGANGTDATRLWASVRNTAGGVPSVLSASGVASVTNNGLAGETKVSFNQDVSHCAFQATLVSPAGGYYAASNEISVFTGFYAGSGLTNNDVVVSTLHGGGLTNGYNFAVTAFC